MNILFVTHSASSHYKIMELYANVAEKLIILANGKNKSNLDYEFPKVKKKDNIKVFYFDGITEGIGKAKGLVKDENIDLIISHCPVSGFIASKTGKKHVFVMCQDYIEYLETSNINILSKLSKKLILRFLLKNAFRNTNVIVLSSHLEKRAKAYGARKISNIPIYGIDTKLFKYHPKDKKLNEELGLKNKKIILTVTRLTPEKGTEFLIKAMKIIKEKIDAKLIIAGKGYEENKLKKMSEELNLKDSIIFAGFREYKEMPKYYNSCDIFVLPSIREGLGFVSGEALACEKPVVASNTGGIPDIVNEKTGILVRPKDYEGIANATIKLLQDKKLAKELVNNGKEHVKKNFDEQVINKRFIEFIKNL